MSTMLGATEPAGITELAAFISSELVGVPSDHIETRISSLLEQLLEHVDADRCALTQLSEDCSRADVVARATRPEAAPLLGPPSWLTPALMARIARGETIRDVGAVHPGIRAQLVVPVAIEGRGPCVLDVNTAERLCSWNPEVEHTLRVIADAFAAALYRRALDEEIGRLRANTAQLSDRLDATARTFSDDIQAVHDFGDIVGDTPALRAALDAVRQVAATDSTVLLCGETGTGKELFARAIHEHSPRRNHPIVCVNCAALPASLIESELFGHERGAFTGAVTARQGRFELANGSTIFLDEIGDLSIDLQAKLLRVLQEREFERVGSSVRRKVDVRVIAATHHDLRADVGDGRFRADLFYRLSVFPIRLPPLRERLEDIPQLVWFLVSQRQRRLHRHIATVTPTAMHALQHYDWPGNVRELENVVERAMILSTSDVLRIDESFGRDDQPVVAAPRGGTLEALERSHIEATLALCRGRINGAGNAAERLGLHPNTLRFRMKKLGIVRPTADDGVAATFGEPVHAT